MRLASTANPSQSHIGICLDSRLPVERRSGRYELPFGGVDVTFNSTIAHWGDQILSDFTPADEIDLPVLGQQGLAYAQRVA